MARKQKQLTLDDDQDEGLDEQPAPRGKAGSPWPPPTDGEWRVATQAQARLSRERYSMSLTAWRTAPSGTWYAWDSGECHKTRQEDGSYKADPPKWDFRWEPAALNRATATRYCWRSYVGGVPAPHRPGGRATFDDVKAYVARIEAWLAAGLSQSAVLTLLHGADVKGWESRCADAARARIARLGLEPPLDDEGEDAFRPYRPYDQLPTREEADAAREADWQARSAAWRAERDDQDDADPDEVEDHDKACCIECDRIFPLDEAYDATGEFCSEACCEANMKRFPEIPPEVEARMIGCRDCSDPLDPVERPTHVCESCERIRGYQNKPAPPLRGYQMQLAFTIPEPRKGARR